MIPRFYLYWYDASSKLEINTFRSLQELREFWGTVQPTSALVHIGVDRPPSTTLTELLKSHVDRVLFTESFRLIAPSSLSTGMCVGDVRWSDISEFHDQKIFVATQGWGYDFSSEESTHVLEAIPPSTSAALDVAKVDYMNDPIFILRTYRDRLFNYPINYLPSSTRRLSNILTRHGIRKLGDLESFTREQLMSWSGFGEQTLTDLLGVLKDVLRSEKCNVDFIDDPHEMLRTYNSVLSTMPIFNVTSTRLYNILRRNNIKVFGDIQRFTVEQMRDWYGFGTQCMDDLIQAMRASVREQLLDSSSSEIEHGTDTFSIGSGADTQSTIKVAETFLASVDVELQKMSERNLVLLMMRFGFEGEASTLKDVGNHFGMSRERVRQIEKKFSQRIQRFLGRTVREKFTELLSGRNEPLYLDLVETEDQWFTGVSAKQGFVVNLLEVLLPSNLRVFKVQERFVVSKCSSDDWRKANTDLLNLLDRYIGQTISETDISLLAEGFLGDAKELTQLLVEEIVPKMTYYNGIFLGRSKSIDSIVKGIMMSAPEPIHYSKAVQLVTEILGEDVGVGTVHNSLAKHGLLFARGMYGERRHLNISDDEESNIVAQVEEIIGLGTPGRQWSCDELLALIDTSIVESEDEIDKYGLNILLNSSQRLKSVGRLVWIVQDSYSYNTERLDLSNAVAAILNTSGRPMHETEILDEIRKYRGIDRYSLIHPSKDIARLPGRYWGLVSRDFVIKPDEMVDMFAVLYRLLEFRSKAIHVSEIRRELAGHIELPVKLSNEMIMGLAQTDSRFRVRLGKLLSLSDWESGRRLTVRQAIETLQTSWSGPTRLENIVKALSELVERRLVQDDSLINNLSNSGFCSIGNGYWDVQPELLYQHEA